MLSTTDLIAEITKTWIEEIGIPNQTLGNSIAPEKALLELMNKQKLDFKRSQNNTPFWNPIYISISEV